ncbi:hypothetical protein SuNHUV7_40370 (plasmid) [Pseudoseohaeicola sp. NH-UV-7]|uniref:DUF6629 family protein n=1 Tax=Sulfitobacter sp. TBRI5 TaxID=2989732 RepID=UPI003A7A467F
MCFSASASFVTAAALVPVGIHTLTVGLKTDRRFLGFAVFPIVFAVQQVLEGGLWMAINRADGSQAHVLALGFLFFAYFLWPFIVPLAAFLVERQRKRKMFFLFVTVVGCLLGLSLFVPLLFHPDWLPIRIVKHSIDYNSTLIWDDIVPHSVLRVVYAGVVCIPLLTSSAKPIRIFGVLITLSVIVGFLFANYAFTSVWCFMAAIVSGYMLFVMRQVKTSSSLLRESG